MNKKLYSEEQVKAAMKLSVLRGAEDQKWMSNADIIATLTPEPSSSDLIDRKEVEKILRDVASNIVQTSNDINKACDNLDLPKVDREIYGIRLEKLHYGQLIVKDMQSRISSLPSASAVEDKGWISMSDSLPEYRPGWSHSREVLVCVNREGSNFVTIGSYSYLNKRWEQHLFDPKYSECITHWMPLPSPPAIPNEG